MNYTESQPYKLGLLYKTLGELFMNPKTDLGALTVVCQELGFKLTLELVPENDSPLLGEPK